MTAQTDRELLTLAAKAAGFELCQWPDEDFLRAEVLKDWRPKWNPLESDGDALRLAIRCTLEIIPIDGGGFDIQRTTLDEPFGIVLATEHGTDPYASCRRAIVRAAAALAPKEQA